MRSINSTIAASISTVMLTLCLALPAHAQPRGGKPAVRGAASSKQGSAGASLVKARIRAGMNKATGEAAPGRTVQVRTPIGVAIGKVDWKNRVQNNVQIIGGVGAGTAVPTSVTTAVPTRSDNHGSFNIDRGRARRPASRSRSRANEVAGAAGGTQGRVGASIVDASIDARMGGRDKGAGKDRRARRETVRVKSGWPTWVGLFQSSVQTDWQNNVQIIGAGGAATAVPTNVTTSVPTDSRNRNSFDRRGR